MQGITAMKVPDKYEPKNADEFGTFDRAMTKLLAVPADEMQRKIAKDKSARRNLKPANPTLPAILAPTECLSFRRIRLLFLQLLR